MTKDKQVEDQKFLLICIDRVILILMRKSRGLRQGILKSRFRSTLTIRRLMG